MERVRMKKVGSQTLPYLSDLPLKPDELLEIKFDDGHIHIGKVLLHEFCCDGEVKPFMPICYHGKKPWVYLVDMKARRLQN